MIYENHGLVRSIWSVPHPPSSGTLSSLKSFTLVKGNNLSSISHTNEWKKILITKLLLFSFSVRFNRRPYITDRKNGQCLFSAGYIPPHVFCPSCPDLVWGKMFGELQQDFDKCEEHVLMASCQSKKLCLNKPFVMKPFPDRQICCLLQIRRKWITSPNETQAHVATDKW